MSDRITAITPHGVATLPIGEFPALAMPDTCSGCHQPLAFEEEKVCVPWPRVDVAMRVYHPSCAPVSEG